jgi:radical SAM superfamily enzyme with C-terminal helix-hairpin-helix motif
VAKRALLVDGYVDEPACFGVPPYISPYVRYLFGVLVAHGFETRYTTADEWRRSGPHGDAVAEADVLAVIAGLTVPGRYRGGSPLTLREIREIASLPRKGPLFLGGPIRHGYTLKGGSRAMDLVEDGVDCFCTGDPEAVIDHYLRTGEYVPTKKRTYQDLRDWAVSGAQVVTSHPFYPWIMAELELSRGCDRKNGHCSFCSEGIHSSYEERPADDIAEEAGALAKAGITAFRFGRCSNILAWGGTDTPSGIRPSAGSLRDLYTGVRDACDTIEVLHTDNCNPLTLASFPEESLAALEEISRWNTEGDVLSLGIENLDPKVRKLNNLKVDEEGAMLAVRLINEAGGWKKRKRGLPSLLPGLNFLAGLAGEDSHTFDANRRFLEGLLAENLMVRRINIRQVMLFPGTPLAGLLQESPSRARKKSFLKWKKWVREEVDPTMLRRVAPVGTVLKRVKLEEQRGRWHFGRPLGSYPLLAGIASSRVDQNDVIDVVVTDHGSRSVTGIQSPVDINRCGMEELETLPGIGKARARRIMQSRPFSRFEEVESVLDEPRLLDEFREIFLFQNP